LFICKDLTRFYPTAQSRGPGSRRPAPSAHPTLSKRLAVKLAQMNQAEVNPAETIQEDWDE
jgi:hypothetical protein